MSHRPPKRFVIVGAGASGALMAAHLLRGDPSGISVTIVEKRAELGRGLAYATGNPNHLLNVRAANMSAFADDPDHFWRWLASRGDVGDIAVGDRFRFFPRGLYGIYLESLLLPHLHGLSSALSVSRDEARAVHIVGSGVEVALRGGGVIEADVAILACGHESVVDEGPLTISPWTEPVGDGAPINSTILILGTGLTMVDTANALCERGHKGPIVALSRRGLLPQPHRQVEALRIDPADAPFGRDIATLCLWLRRRARQCEAEGGDWRSVIDGLRPHTQSLWRGMPATMRKRFLEHARPWWDTHRHRMAPEIAARVSVLMESGQLRVIAGKIGEVRGDRHGARVSVRRRGARAIETLDVSRIISCKGVSSDPAKNSNPVVQSLFAQGLARTEPLRIGLDVDADGAIVDVEGRPSSRLFAIGPMSQAAFWEITAVPDIRLQTAELAARLLRPSVTVEWEDDEDRPRERSKAIQRS
jgi:uncharacterized NAD(P)/FAD-binding protein YdhS